MLQDKNSKPVNRTAKNAHGALIYLDAPKGMLDNTLRRLRGTTRNGERDYTTFREALKAAIMDDYGNPFVGSLIDCDTGEVYGYTTSWGWVRLSYTVGKIPA